MLPLAVPAQLTTPALSTFRYVCEPALFCTLKVSAVGDDAEVCFTLTPVASVVGANALLPFSRATLDDKLESLIVPVSLLAETELMTVAPCVPVTSPAKLPLKL